MDDGRIKNIVIVGGGSSGWMSAAFLCRALPEVRITLIEASDISTIGVGEATIASISGFLSALQLDEKDWMPFCHATYKYQIRFKNWHHQGDDYWHPFETLAYYNNHIHIGQYWYMKYLMQGNMPRDSLYDDCFLGVGISKENRITRLPETLPFSDNYSVTVDGDEVPLHVLYAYHFDAGLFGEYLKQKVAKPAGVKQVIDKVTGVNTNEHGFIESLDTESGEKIAGDLFIDCSGFRAMLIDKVMDEPFDSFSDTLYCDKAMAMRVPYRDIREELEPFTTATAMSSGWVWNTPLTSRRGTGYVYCSSFKSTDEAEREYRQFLGEDNVKDVTPNYIDIRVGKHRRTWVKNCVAIGLSSGFIEPLESTGLHFVYAAVIKLAEALSGRHFNAPIIAGYNHYVTSMMEEARDFLAIHYALTNREDTEFWRDVKYNTKLSESLGSLLARYKNGFPNRLKHSEYITFSEHSWVCILAGMNYLPGVKSYFALNNQDAERQLRLMDAIKQLQNNLKSTAVNHYDFLSRRDKLGAQMA